VTPPSSGTVVEAGSFRCRGCDTVLTLESAGVLAECPNCGAVEFDRCPLFATSSIDAAGAPAAKGSDTERIARIAHAREALDAPGDYLCYEEHGEMRIIPLTGAWTRIGRSLSADVHLEDQTVSRRHAMIVRDGKSIRALDDRSMNGLYVNGERVESTTLHDGDELLVGRYRLLLVRVGPGLEGDPQTQDRAAGAA